MNKKILILSACALFALQACKNDKKTGEGTDAVVQEIKLVSPEFNADSAFAYTKAQVDFGPRVPGTAAHQKCADYLVAKLKSFGAEVQLSGVKTTTYDGKTYQLKNISA